MGEWIEIELVEEPARQRRVALEPSEPRPPRDPPRLDERSRRIVVIGVGVVVVAGIGWALSRSDTDVSTGATATTLDESAAGSPDLLDVDTTQPAPSTTRARVTTTTDPPIVVEELGGQVLPTPSGLELVAVTTRGDLLEIDLDGGMMTTTDLPGASNGSPATIVVGADWTYVHRWDGSTSILIPRGQLPGELTSAPDMSNGVYPGPEPETLWVLQSDATGRPEGMDLIRIDGEPLGRSIDLQGWWPMQSDRAGGVVVQAGGGVYVVSEAGVRWVAHGEMVGVGVNHFLVRECDEALLCGLVVVDRRSGERRQVPGVPVDGHSQYWGWIGTDSATVSPDGTAAVLFGLYRPSSGAALIDTGTGANHELTAVDDGRFAVVWSDDSRYVVYTDNTTLTVFDRVEGETIVLGNVVDLINITSR